MDNKDSLLSLGYTRAFGITLFSSGSMPCVDDCILVLLCSVALGPLTRVFDQLDILYVSVLDTFSRNQNMPSLCFILVVLPTDVVS